MPSCSSSGERRGPGRRNSTARWSPTAAPRHGGGGTVVVGFFSGIVDPADQIRPGPYPTALRGLLGLHVEEIVPFQASDANRVRMTTGEEFGCDTWAEVVRPEGAESLATFADDF